MECASKEDTGKAEIANVERIKKYFLSEGLENDLIIWKYRKMFGLFGCVFGLFVPLFFNISSSWRCYKQEVVRLKCRKAQVKMCLGTTG